MERTIKERLLEFISYLGMGQTKFERSAGLSNGYVNNIKKSPSIKILQRIFGTYPQLNKDWLLTGTGSMLNEAPVPEASASGKSRKYEIEDDNPVNYMVDGIDDNSSETEYLRNSLKALREKYAALEATLAKKESQLDTLLSLLNELKQKQK